MRRTVRLSLAAVLAFSSAASAQEGWERYRPGTLREVEAEGLAELQLFLDPEGPGIALSGRDHPTRVRVVYTGESRESPASTARFVDLWVRAFGHEPGTEKLFQRELLFREEGRGFWLPVQGTLLPHFAEMKAGAAVTLYVIWIGAQREKGEVVAYFLVNEFDEGPAP